jgi:hypothetical protein
MNEKKSLKAYLLIIMSFFVFGHLVSASAGHDRALLVKANKLYLEGNYKKTIEKYNKLLKEKGDLGEVHFNLGNTYFRNREKGKAIFHFRKATEVLPRDGDVKYNLNYLRGKTIDKIESKSFLNGHHFFPFNEKEISFMLLIFWGLFWFFSLIYLFSKGEMIKWARNLSFMLALFFCVPFIQKNVGNDGFGVITAEKTSVYSGIGKDNVKLFVLHEGTEVTLKDNHSNGWVYIEVDQSKKGWMKKKDLIF